MQDLELPATRTDRPIYLGIDVSKSHLDGYVYPLSKSLRVTNDPVGFQQLNQLLKEIGPTHVIVEATGKYHRGVHRALSANGHAVSVISPYRSRRFAEALGQMAKTDRIDARMLASFGAQMNPQPAQPACRKLEDLQELLAARRNARKAHTALANQITETKNSFVLTRLRRRLRQLKTQISDFDAEIRNLIAQDPTWARQMEILLSIPGIGFVNAVTCLIDLPEIGKGTGKQMAALVGVAPMARDSGSWSGKRRIRGGRAPVRYTLYMAAVAAIRCNPDLKILYQRLIAKGKPPKVAMTAVMRKLIVLANALIAENRKWSPQHP